MLKKIMGTVLALSLTASSAFASVSVEPEDVANDLMKVSSQGFKGESLSIIITNPGFTLEQALAGENGAIQYFGSYVPDEENFSFRSPRCCHPFGNITLRTGGSTKADCDH